MNKKKRGRFEYSLVKYCGLYSIICTKYQSVDVFARICGIHPKTFKDKLVGRTEWLWPSEYERVRRMLQCTNEMFLIIMSQRGKEWARRQKIHYTDLEMKTNAKMKERARAWKRESKIAENERKERECRAEMRRQKMQGDQNGKEWLF